MKAGPMGNCAELSFHIRRQDRCVVLPTSVEMDRANSPVETPWDSRTTGELGVVADVDLHLYFRGHDGHQRTYDLAVKHSGSLFLFQIRYYMQVSAF